MHSRSPPGRHQYVRHGAPTPASMPRMPRSAPPHARRALQFLDRRTGGRHRRKGAAGLLARARTFTRPSLRCVSRAGPSSPSARPLRPTATDSTPTRHTRCAPRPALSFPASAHRGQPAAVRRKMQMTRPYRRDARLNRLNRTDRHRRRRRRREGALAISRRARTLSNQPARPRQPRSFRK